MNPIEQLKRQELFIDKALIGDSWVSTQETLPVYNKATGEKLADVPSLTAADAKHAIEQAHIAFDSWRSRTASERSKILRKWFDLITANAHDLAIILTAEGGKPLKEAEGEILYGAAYIEWFAEEAKRIYGDTIPQSNNDQRLIVIKQPVGVVGAITPWNFPNAMIARKVAPALAAGCTMVLKPPTETPLSAFALAYLGLEAGVPPGVFNVLTGNEIQIGGELTSNPLVRKITFTGSTEVGKILIKQSADTLKKFTMELGGNAPFIVFDDADVDKAVEGAMLAKFRNAGQTCVCANRMFVQSKVYDEFTEKFTKKVAQLKVGNGFEPGTEIGPLINQHAVTKMNELLTDAKQKGAKITLGGGPHSLGNLFYQPTVVTRADRKMRFFDEEIFGPIASIYSFENEAEVVKLANDTPFGLAGYFYSRDIGRIWRIAEQLEYGMIGVNSGLVSNVMAPFGGIKQSGFGREGSKYGIEDYLSIKFICMAGVL
jgi:succinate-semialdehyde dehydrogenase / glutarate-semialdehyde dehydrogenase